MSLAALSPGLLIMSSAHLAHAAIELQIYKTTTSVPKAAAAGSTASAKTAQAG